METSVRWKATSSSPHRRFFINKAQRGDFHVFRGLYSRLLDKTPAVQIFIHVPSQTLDLLDPHGVLLRRYPCSTSKFGLGTEPGSNKTPTGHFRIAEKHGDDAPAGMIFKSRIATGKFGSENDEADHVQTRILWLDGLDKANANTKSRYIYLHGTNAETRLGTPASHGCVRMGNDDIIELYDTVAIGTKVEISADAERKPKRAKARAKSSGATTEK